MHLPKFLSFLSPYIDGDSPTRIIQGLVVGAVATMIIGFSWGGWHTGGTVKEMVSDATEKATVIALAPICADRFQKAAKEDNTLIAALGAVSYWQRDAHMMENGWATFSGSPEPNRTVAEACANMLKVALKLK